jgi:hypothetical protein
MIKNAAINWAKTGHSIVWFEVSSATRTVHSKTGRVVSLPLADVYYELLEKSDYSLAMISL